MCVSPAGDGKGLSSGGGGGVGGGHFDLIVFLQSVRHV